MVQLNGCRRSGLAVKLVASVLVAAGSMACESDQPNDPSGVLSVTGTVREQGSNAPIAGATVTIQSKSAMTSASGQYAVTDLTAGANVELRVTHQGHTNVTQSVTIDGEETVNVTMSVPAVRGYVGTYNGTWRNTNSNNTGNANMTVAVDTIAQSLTIGVTLTGTVFGIPNPPTQTGTTQYSTTGNTTISLPLGFGTLNATIAPGGAISGSGVSALPGFFVSRVDFTGNATPTSVVVNGTITFTDGTTNLFVVNMTK